MTTAEISTSQGTGFIDWPQSSVFPLVTDTDWCGNHERDSEKPYLAPVENKAGQQVTKLIIPRSANEGIDS